MVFDSFTQVSSDGAGFILDKSAIVRLSPAPHTTVSGVTTLVVDLESVPLVVTTPTVIMVLLHLVFSTDETPRTARVFGELMSVNGVTKAGTPSIGATMFGATSGARAWF